MKRYSLEEIQKQFAALNIPWINHFHIVGIRSKADNPDVFDDQIYIIDLYKTNCYTATTNPGLYWLQNFINGKGAAVVKANMQFKDLWALGFHQGKYPALVQVNPVTVYRDNDKDNKAEQQGVLDTGLFGINCHHANNSWKSILVGKWSAGCQVLPDPKDWEEFLTLCKQSQQTRFTYTLLEEF